MAGGKKEHASWAFFAAGASAGIVEAVVVHPLDMVRDVLTAVPIKTRHQLSVVKNENSLRTAHLLIREGGVPRLYRGLTPEIVGMIPKSSAMYAGYDLSRLLLAKTPLGDSSLSVFLAGCISGIPEAIATTPFQVVKIRLQARENVSKFSGPVDCAMQTWKMQGVKGLLTGLQTTIWRNSIWNSIYFYSMHEMKKASPPPPQQHQQVLQNLLFGFVAGFVATAADAPFDTVKSRIQAPLPSSSSFVEKPKTFTMLSEIIRQEGLLACYKGFPPKAVRMALGGAVAIAAYELRRYDILVEDERQLRKWRDEKQGQGQGQDQGQGQGKINDADEEGQDGGGGNQSCSS
eukprot:768793-Hanusia_phi.AAC.8